MDEPAADDDLSPEEEEAWCAERLQQVTEYLGLQDGLEHGEIGEWPAWHLAPYVAIFAVESVKAPGSVGWWVICGDLPSDYCSSDGGCDNPRRAMRRFAEGWQDAITTTPVGAPTLGDTGLPAKLAPVLQSRIDFLLDMVRDGEIWPPDAPDSDSSTDLH